MFDAKPCNRIVELSCHRRSSILPSQEAEQQLFTFITRDKVIDPRRRAPQRTHLNEEFVPR